MQLAHIEVVTPGCDGRFFDIQSDNGILKGVKDVQTSFDQRRLTLFRS
jgi:hypothetical protein